VTPPPSLAPIPHHQHRRHQTQHVEELPLGTRGGMIVRHKFPADGEYVFSGQLLKTVAEGLVGVEGHETPHQFIVTIDGTRVFSAPIGGKEDHEKATENKPVDRQEFDKRMMSPRIKVTAGLHEVGFTFVERPTQEQEHVAARAALQSGKRTIVGHAAPAARIIEGPYARRALPAPTHGRNCFVCTPKTAAQRSAMRRRSCRTSRARVPSARHQRPTSTRRWRSTKKAADRGDFDAGIPPASPDLTSPSFLFRSEGDLATLASGTPHRVTELELAADCRSSCGAASRMTSC
jgi:hypothetical protein